MTTLRSFILLFCATLAGAAFARARLAPIAVLRAESCCAASERAFAAARAADVHKMLGAGGVAADLLGDRALAQALAGRRLALVVTWSHPTAAACAALNAFRARGGRVIAVQCPPPVPGVESLALFAAPRGTSERARDLLRRVNAHLPGTWNEQAWAARRRQAAAAARAYGARLAPRPGEIHAVWDHAGTGLYPGDWPKTLRALAANGVTDLFVNVGGAGFAHYASGVLPRSALYAARGDQLAQCLAAARGTGVRVHAWFLCFSAARATPARLTSLAKRGWRVKTAAGRLTEYLDPANAALRWHLLQALDEIVRAYPVAGLHLDFIRWYENTPRRPGAARHVETFVEAVRTRQRAARPACWLTAAVLGNYPGCATSVGQDWGRWLDRGLIDYAVPMDYTNDPAAFTALVTAQGLQPARARRTLAGLGVSAKESQLAPAAVVDQVAAARRAGLAGVALFDLDATLAEDVLPVLRAGAFARIRPAAAPRRRKK